MECFLQLISRRAGEQGGRCQVGRWWQRGGGERRRRGARVSARRLHRLACMTVAWSRWRARAASHTYLPAKSLILRGAFFLQGRSRLFPFFPSAFLGGLVGGRRGRAYNLDGCNACQDTHTRARTCTLTCKWTYLCCPAASQALLLRPVIKTP